MHLYYQTPEKNVNGFPELYKQYFFLLSTITCYCARSMLREGTVPQYFRNMLGGAIWWEVNALTDESITKAQRRKMKCVCAEEGTSRTGETDIG